MVPRARSADGLVRHALRETSRQPDSCTPSDQAGYIPAGLIPPSTLPSHALAIPLAFRRGPGARGSARGWALRPRCSPRRSAAFATTSRSTPRTAPDPHAARGHDVRRHGPGPGAALAAGVDARRVRDLELRAVGLELLGHVRREGAPLGQARLRHVARPADGAKNVTVTFDYLADSLDNAIAWARGNFAFFNGTNVFLYPEGRPIGLRRDGDGEDRSVVARHDGHEAGGCAAHVLVIELPRPRGHAVLRRRSTTWTARRSRTSGCGWRRGRRARFRARTARRSGIIRRR